MPASAPDLAPSGFFALRTPLLPLDALTRRAGGLRAPAALAQGQDLGAALTEDRKWLVDQLRADVNDPVIREALFIASPTLDEAIDAWLANPEDSRARGVVDILVRYLTRMAARPTPFGLFSGCSVGTLGDKTALALGPRSSNRRHTRLDMLYLSALCEVLHRDPALRGSLRFRRSTGLYEAAGQLRYAEARSDPKSRTLTYHLVSVEHTDYLDATLARADAGARPGELVAALVERDPEVAREEAEAYVDQLIESQILASDLAPPITGDEPIRAILATLAESSAGQEPAAVLARVDEAVHALDEGGLGLPSSRYRAIADTLAALPAKPELARLFQVDLYKPTSNAVLGAEVVREMQRAVGLMARIAPPADRHGLTRFRQALTERYGERLGGPLAEDSTVPLVEVLDEETGIGFFSPLGESAEPSPLLDGLTLPPDPAAPLARFGPRDQHLLRRVGEAARAHQREWVLDEEDLARLTSTTQVELPGAFALVATLSASSPDALERGDFRLFVHAVSGPSGAVLFGRFCHGDPSLRRAVDAHLRAEEAARPDAIFAEVVHLPEGRLGNVLCRPALRGHEIAYLGRSGLSEERRIPVTDLRVGLSGERLVLYSVRHAREVIPRLTSAHNYESAALGVYRFLCSLQQDSHSYGSWTWGAFGRAPFLPRVSHGRTVLSAARWNLARDQLALLGKGSGVDRYRSVQRMRAELGLPRWVGLAEGDNVLPVDLDNTLHVDSFVQLVKAQEAASFVELFADGLVAEGPEGHFVHELVVPFVTKRAETPAAPAPPVTPSRTSVPRSFLPGSEWLYAKIYTGTAGADVVLKDVVAPVIEAARAAGTARSWFFVRHGDPRWHVRLRLRGDGRQMASTLLPALHDAAAPLLRHGRLWKLELDTYEREVGRYGGPDGIELAEAIFEADSDAVLSIVQLLEVDEAADERWRLALRGMHLLLLDMGLDLGRRTEVLREVRASFGAEHRVDVGVERQLGHKFRAERPALEALLATPVGTEHALDPGFEVLARRSEKISAIAGELSARERDGRLTISVQKLAASFLHMHANRLLRAEQRAQELVLYDFLLRLYESEAARARRAR